MWVFCFFFLNIFTKVWGREKIFTDILLIELEGIPYNIFRSWSYSEHLQDIILINDIIQRRQATIAHCFSELCRCPRTSGTDLDVTDYGLTALWAESSMR